MPAAWWATRQSGSPRRGRVRATLRRLEGDPGTQYRMHMVAARFWLVNAVVVILVFFLAHPLWDKAGVLYLVLVSLYANWSTDAGAMSAADAATDEAITAHAQEAADG